MIPTRHVTVSCRISRSGFSGEHVFHVKRADGGSEYVGVAPVHYFRGTNAKPLASDAATRPGEVVNGQIVALLIENGGDKANVVFPGGEMLQVKSDQVHHSAPEEYCVPV